QLKWYVKYLKKTLNNVIIKVHDYWKGNNAFNIIKIGDNEINFFDILKDFCILWMNQIEPSTTILETCIKGFKNFIDNNSYGLSNIDKNSFADQLKLFFYIVHVSSILTNLDKWEAKTSRTSKKFYKDLKFDNIFNNTSIQEDPHNLIFSYLENNKKDSNLNPIRDKFSSLINQKIKQSELNQIYTIIAPCGIGKTLTLLNLAFNLREKFYNKYKFYPKIIYALPFISICDQLENIVKKIFNCESQTSLLTIHHHLANLERYQENNREEEYVPISEKNKENSLNTYEIKYWYSEIIITTTVKLFNTLFTFGKENLMRFHKLANSIIIIDEYHCIPIKYHELIRQCLKIFKDLFNSTFILATATTSGLFIKGDPIIELTSSISNLFNQINRYKIKFNNSIVSSNGIIEFCKKMSLDESKEFCKKICLENNDKSIMIVVNTRKLAREVYEYLNYECDLHRKIFHLSKNIIPFFRKKILTSIEEILNNSENNAKNIILITTQLIEAGIDISFQKIIRDLGPLYSIVQVAGRCNRNMEIMDANKIPIIEIINIENSFNHIYDVIDIESIKDFFKIFYERFKANIFKDFGLNQKSSSSSKDKKIDILVSENQIRELFPEYPKILNEKKRRKEECYEKVKELDYNFFTKKFKLINELPKIPIIILPSSGKCNDPIIKKARVLVEKLRNNELNEFPTILYHFMTDIYKSSEEKILQLPNLENPFEKFSVGESFFYVLDLENPNAKKYYHEDLGLLI
ncbi:MAG: CRISPR-associated helicase Cas3', partial [Promethearchaeia archaeon]